LRANILEERREATREATVAEMKASGLYSV